MFSVSLGNPPNHQLCCKFHSNQANTSLILPALQHFSVIPYLWGSVAGNLGGHEDHGGRGVQPLHVADGVAGPSEEVQHGGGHLLVEQHVRGKRDGVDVAHQKSLRQKKRARYELTISG
jgi:hypothetical protein